MHNLIAQRRAITIMALGSSSTAGAGASTPLASYPAQLQIELHNSFPDIPITVVNRGVNGEEAPDMLVRFDQAASTDKPDVVLWQLGTNAVLRDAPDSAIAQNIAEGLRRMKALGADVVLIDLQFAPEVLERGSEAEGMERTIAAASTGRSVDLFPRFQVRLGLRLLRQAARRCHGRRCHPAAGFRGEVAEAGLRASLTPPPRPACRSRRRRSSASIRSLLDR
jgi:hypothetical protein